MRPPLIQSRGRNSIHASFVNTIVRKIAALICVQVYPIYQKRARSSKHQEVNLSKIKQLNHRQNESVSSDVVVHPGCVLSYQNKYGRQMIKVPRDYTLLGKPIVILYCKQHSLRRGGIRVWLVLFLENVLLLQQ